MKRKMTAGSTGRTIPVLTYDTSNALTALAYNASGLVAEYRREGQGTWTTFSLSAGTLGTWSSGGWSADGSQTGAYELGIPNAVIAAGAGVTWAEIRLRGATGVATVFVEIELDVLNYQGNVAADVQTIKAQAVTCAAPVTVPATISSFSGGSVVLASNGLDNVVVEAGVNARQALSPILAASAGVLSGAGTGSIVIKGAGVATTRITATTDSSGNRTSTTVTPPA